MLTRRLLISGFTALPVIASAHDGHDLSRIGASVVSTQASIDGFAMSVAIRNERDEAIELKGVYCEWGDVVATKLTALPPRTTATFELVLKTSNWPGIFTLILDFAEAGRGPLTVIPDLA